MACGRLAISRFAFESDVKVCILTQCRGEWRITESVVARLKPPSRKRGFEYEFKARWS